MSKYHIEGEGYRDGFGNGLTMRLRHTLTPHKDSKIERSCAKRADGHVFHFCSVAGIAVHLRIFFDTARYVLLFPVLQYYFGQY
jgi:hypothetical protein